MVRSLPFLLCFAGVAPAALASCRKAPPPRPEVGPGAPASVPALRADDAGPSYRVVGRADGGRSAWSGTTIRAHFTGPSLAARLRVGGEATPYTVYVDDRPPQTREVGPGETRVELASGLDPAAPHTVRAVREAEAFAGVHELLGIELGAGGRFLSDKPPALRMEIVGDSISCGYGVLGDDGRCRFSFATERVTSTYGFVAAAALDAELTVVAWSGKGAYRNYDGTTTDTMRDLFALAIAAPQPVSWAFAGHPAPDVTVLALGTNDYLGGGGKPLDEDAFEKAYADLVTRVREAYPSTFVLVTTPPMLDGKVGEAARRRLERVVARRTDRIALVAFPSSAPRAPGMRCDHHPDVAMNAAMAEALTAAVRKHVPRK